MISKHVINLEAAAEVLGSNARTSDLWETSSHSEVSPLKVVPSSRCNKATSGALYRHHVQLEVLILGQDVSTAPRRSLNMSSASVDSGFRAYLLGQYVRSPIRDFSARRSNVIKRNLEPKLLRQISPIAYSAGYTISGTCRSNLGREDWLRPLCGLEATHKYFK